MEKIQTGFSIKPLVGHIEANQAIARYFKTEYFIDFLQKRSLWFTRIYNWQLIDPNEAELLPVFEKGIRAEHKSSEYEYDFHKAIIDIRLKSNFGCCFTIYENKQTSHMWDTFAGEGAGFGAVIVTKAQDLHLALLNIKGKYPNQLFSKVKYVNDLKAKSMKPEECSHSNKHSFNYEESHFLKRIGYSREKEVRAVLGSRNNQWTTLLHRYIEERNISYSPIDAAQPRDCIRIDMQDSMHVRTSRDRAVFLNKDEGQGFIQYLKKHIEDSNPGIYVPFNLAKIQKIIFHPKLNHDHRLHKEIASAVASAGINCEMVLGQHN